MKLENCGRCGLEPDQYGCPVHGRGTMLEWNETRWNAAQFSARTERINAAADRLMVKSWNYGNVTDHSVEIMAKVCISVAQDLIGQEDAAARVRWAEMQGE